MSAESLMNCRACMASDCGIYYIETPTGWGAAYQCSACAIRSSHGYGGTKDEACDNARANWQSENAPVATQEGR